MTTTPRSQGRNGKATRSKPAPQAPPPASLDHVRDTLQTAARVNATARALRTRAQSLTSDSREQRRHSQEITNE